MPMSPVLHASAYCLDYLGEQVADVAAADLAAQPPGVVNHPAWTIGHLALATEMLGGVLGVPARLPQDWARRHGAGSRPVPDAGAYAGRDEGLAALRDALARVHRAVGSLDEARLNAPFPDPAYRDVFPTLRHALTQVLVGHASFHVGQVAVWRRAMGLPGIGRSFE